MTEASHYLRVVRLRWRWVVVLAVVGAAAGYASTLLDREEAAPVVTYWAAKDVLVASMEQGGTAMQNLPQLALRVTGGAVPQAVAGERGGEPTELAARIRTVTRTDLSSLEITAVATEADEARELANAFSGALLDYLGAEEDESYELALSAATEEVRAIRADLDALEAEIDDRGDELLDELASLEVQRDSRQVAYEEALLTENALVDQGPPLADLQRLSSVPPFTISAREFEARVAEGRRGQNNYNGKAEPGVASDSSGLGDKIQNPAVRAGLGGLAGLLLGIGAVLLHLRLDPRLRTKREVEEAFGAPVIAEIPRFRRRQRRRELHSQLHPRSAVTEAYRVVRSALLFARASSPLSELDADPLTARWAEGLSGNGHVNGSGHANGNGHSESHANGNGHGSSAGVGSGREVRVIMVTSPGPSEGKTTTAANLAVVLAEAGYEVLVVNCDYRLPRIHEYFGMPHDPRRALPTAVPGVTIVAEVTESVVTNPTTVVESQRALIEKARQRYDVVILDTAPLLATNDAVALLPVVDLVVLVAREGRTAREGATEARELLQRRRAWVAGVVLTDATGFGGSRYYQKYRYGSYYSESTRRLRPKQAKATRSAAASEAAKRPGSGGLDRDQDHPAMRPSSGRAKKKGRLSRR